MIVFDIEADGLLDEATKIHCLSFKDLSKPSGVVTMYDYSLMKDFLLQQSILIGHNIVMYDVPLLEKILGIKIKAKLYDTLAMSWVVNTERPKHGLESFGIDFNLQKPVVEDWHNLDREVYGKRCEIDVRINTQLWHNLIQKYMMIYKDKENLDRFLQYLTFKMRCAANAEQTGWRFDRELANKCVAELERQKAEKIAELASVMPMRTLFRKKSKPKVMYKKDGTLTKQGQEWNDLLLEHMHPSYYVGEIEVVKGVEDPNPNSVDQVKSWLYDLGWEPCTFKYIKESQTETRLVPQVRKNGMLTPSVKRLIKDNPIVETLDGLTVINHRLGIFNSMIECEHNGFLRASIKGLTNTLRFKHNKPLVNLPSVDKPWGKEIRGCLIAPEGFVLCGADMTSLEDTTKRHYMKPYDPVYVEEMSVKGFDPHLDLAKYAGVITQDDIDAYNRGERPELKDLRKNYKVVNYSATYGVGADKLSRETGMTTEEASKLLTAYWKRNWSVKAFAESQPIRKINGEMWVQNPVSKFWHSLRFEKDVFSTLNQSTGAYCFDKWVAYYMRERPNIIGQFHDESINLVKEGEQQQHEATLRSAINKLNLELKLNVNLGIDVQFGNKYSEIH